LLLFISSFRCCRCVRWYWYWYYAIDWLFLRYFLFGCHCRAYAIFRFSMSSLLSYAYFRCRFFFADAADDAAFSMPIHISMPPLIDAHIFRHFLSFWLAADAAADVILILFSLIRHTMLPMPCHIFAISDYASSMFSRLSPLMIFAAYHRRFIARY